MPSLGKGARAQPPAYQKSADAAEEEGQRARLGNAARGGVWRACRNREAASLSVFRETCELQAKVGLKRDRPVAEGDHRAAIIKRGDITLFKVYCVYQSACNSAAWIEYVENERRDVLADAARVYDVLEQASR